MSKKVLRVELLQPRANYRQLNSIDCRQTYPMPPPSTVIGAIHHACGWKEYHPMNISISAETDGFYEQFFTQVSPHAKTNDRGILIKTEYPNMLGKSYVEVAEQGVPDVVTGENNVILDSELYSEYKQLETDIKTINLEIKAINEKIKSLKKQKKENKDCEFVKTINEFIADEENRLNSKKKELDTKNYNYDKYMVIFKKFNSYQVLSGVHLYLYLAFETAEDLICAAENAYAIDHIGRNEDKVLILDSQVIELDENVAGKKSDDNIQSYIDVSLIDDDIVFSYSNFDNGGTVYYLPKDYRIFVGEEAKLLGVPEGQRVFNKYWLMNMSKITVDEDIDSYENLYFDNTNGTNIVVNLI